MKKIVTLSVLLFAICTFYWACKKDQTSAANKNLTTEEQQLITNAKTYFENTVKIKAGNDKALADTIPAGGAQFNAVKSLIKNAVWSDAYVQTISIGKIVVVPIHFSSSLYIYTNYTDSTVRLPINKLSKLIVYTDSLKQLHAEVVTEFPDDNFIKNSTSSFSGIALVQDWQGNYLHGYQYSASGIKKLAFSSAANAGDKTTNSAVAPDVKPAPPTETCYESYVTTCVSTADNSQKYCTTTTQELGCISDPSDTDDGSSTPGGGDYGGIAGNPGSVAAPPPPCASSFKFITYISADPKNVSTSGGWQVAAVRGIHLNFASTDPTEEPAMTVSMPVLYFGLPLVRYDGTTYSSSDAADKAQGAVLAGENAIIAAYHSGNYNTSSLQAIFKQAMISVLATYAGTVSTTGAGAGIVVSPTNVTTADYSCW